jgi:hypothetical protein
MGDNDRTVGVLCAVETSPVFRLSPFRRNVGVLAHFDKAFRAKGPTLIQIRKAAICAEL